MRRARCRSRLLVQDFAYGAGLLALTSLLLAVVGQDCMAVSEPPPTPPDGGGSGSPDTLSDRSLSGARLVEAIRSDPEAIEIIRQDKDLVRRFNRKPSIPQVLRELRSEPGLFAYRVRKTLSDPWVLFGFGAQSLFLARFLVQWIASERRKRSHIPVSFWYFSLAGGITLFVYAVRQLDPVFIIGQGLGCFIYVRNLVLIYRRSGGLRAARPQEARNEPNADPSE